MLCYGLIKLAFIFFFNSLPSEDQTEGFISGLHDGARVLDFTFLVMCISLVYLYDDFAVSVYICMIQSCVELCKR